MALQPATRMIAPEATEFHGIDEAMVRDAEPAAVVLERFRDWAGDRPLVAHNADFDARVLAFEYARARLAPPPGWLIDTLKQVVPIWKKEHWADGQTQWVHPGLETPTQRHAKE